MHWYSDTDFRIDDENGLVVFSGTFSITMTPVLAQLLYQDLVEFREGRSSSIAEHVDISLLALFGWWIASTKKGTNEAQYLSFLQTLEAVIEGAAQRAQEA